MSEKLAQMVCFRVNAAERAMLDELKERLGTRLAPGFKMTDRALVFAACERLTAHLAKLDKDRDRRDAEGKE